MVTRVPRGSLDTRVRIAGQVQYLGNWTCVGHVYRTHVQRACNFRDISLGPQGAHVALSLSISLIEGFALTWELQ
jgi:hypothetical protein